MENSPDNPVPGPLRTKQAHRRLAFSKVPADALEDHPCTINRAPFPVFSAVWTLGGAEGARGLLVLSGGGGNAGSGVGNGMVVCEVAEGGVDLKLAGAAAGKGGAGELHLVPLGELDAGDELAYHLSVHPGLQELSCAVGGQNYVVGVGADGVARQRAAWTADRKDYQTCSRYSRDGSLLVTGGEDRVVRVWRKEGAGGGAAEKPALELDGKLGDDVSSVDVSADVSLVAATAGTDCLQLWDAATGKMARELRAQHSDGKPLEFRTCRFAVAPGGGAEVLVAVLTAAPRGPGLLGVWDPRTGEELQRLPMCAELLVQAETSPSGRFFACATNEATVHVLELGEDARLRPFCRQVRCHDLPSTGLAFSPDEEFVASVSPDRSVVFVPVRRGATLCGNLVRVVLNVAAAFCVGALAASFAE